MTIRVTRPPREDLRFVVGVFLDGHHCAVVEPGATVRLRGDGQVQRFTVRVTGVTGVPDDGLAVPHVDLSVDMNVTDPGDGREIGVAVSYRHLRGRLFGRRQPLTMKVVQEVAVPAELTAQLESDPEALEAWTATPGELKSLYSSWIVAPRRGKERLARAAATAYWATEGTLEGHVQRPSWIEALGSLDAP